MALQNAVEGFWRISSEIEMLKDRGLQGFEFEVRQRSESDPDYGHLYRALADMAKDRLDIIHRRRSSKGTWFALIEVTRWNNDRVGEIAATFEEQCEGKSATEKAARRMLAEHAEKFSDDTTAEARTLTDLEMAKERVLR